MLRRRAELAGQATLTAGVIGDDPHDQLDLLAHRGALLHLCDVVERHHPHAATDGVDDVSPSLAGIGINDLRLGNVLGQRHRDLLHEPDLPPRRAIEVTPQAHESTNDGRIGIALDGVVGHHAGECRAPSRQLSRDDAEVDDVERILDGALHARLEGRIVPLMVSRDLLSLLAGEADEGQGVGRALMEVVSRREAKALPDGRSAEVSVARTEGGRECIERRPFDGGEIFLSPELLHRHQCSG